MQRPSASAAWIAGVALCLATAACAPSRVDSGALRGDDAQNPGAGATARAALAYDPCPAKDAPCTILPFGDSITAGQGSSAGGGYRRPLFELAQRDGRKITFVGSQQDRPASAGGDAFPPHHEGHPGFVISGGSAGYSGIAPIAVARMARFRPNVVALMIGTNDMTHQLDVANAPGRLGALIDAILASDPRVLLLVAQIVPTRFDDENALIRAYNAAIPALVQERAAAGKHIVVVDMYAPFVRDADYKTTLLADPVHPNDRGYALIADAWYAALAPLLY